MVLAPPSPYLYVEPPISTVVVFEGGAFGRQLGLDGISAKKRPKIILFSLSALDHVRLEREGG